MIGKSMKTILLKENIKVNTFFDGGKIKIKFVLNDIKVYKTENNVKTLIDKTEILFFAAYLN